MPENALSPINDVTKLDLLVERRDGGIEMCIVAQGAVDGRPETLARIETKVRNYLREALDESFREEYGGIPPQEVQIFFESKFAVDPAVLCLISGLASEAEQMGIRIEFRRYQTDSEESAN